MDAQRAGSPAPSAGKPPGSLVNSPTSHPARGWIALAAGWLALLVVLYTRLLVPDPGDNAYVWLRATGLALAPPAVAFALTAALPWPLPRQASWLAAQGMLAVSGGLSLLLLLIALVMTPFQGHGDRPVLLYHAISFVLLAGTLYVLWFRLRRGSAAQQ